MKAYKIEFIEFLLANNALKFGEFTLKSGRLSPYFLNTGMLFSGEAIRKLGNFYASTIADNLEEERFNVVFGPAYKGIPLAITTVNALYSDFDINSDYAFNRKEAKDHGDKGLIVGKKLSPDDRLVLVDDVITAGTAIRECVDILKNEGDAKIEAVVVSVDRMEKGKGDVSAIQELSAQLNLQFFPIINILEIIEYMEKSISKGSEQFNPEMIEKMLAYRKTYGV